MSDLVPLPPGPPAFRSETRAMTLARLEREIRGRRSLLRRRRASEALDVLIQIREATDTA